VKTVKNSNRSSALRRPRFECGRAVSKYPGEGGDLKSLPASVERTINQRAAAGEIVQVRREDNYEVVDKTNGNESGFEVDPTGKLVKQHTETR
jgi:hypothetical protein